MKLFASAFFALASLWVSPVSGADGTDCPGDREESTVTVLEFVQGQTTLPENTLHEPGGKLRYHNVGTFESNTLDLVVTITSGDYTDIVDAWAAKDPPLNPPAGTGLKNNGALGTINLQTVQGKPKSGEGNFRMCIVEAGTDIPVTLEKFSWSVFDLDIRGAASDTKNQERLIIDVGQVVSYQLVEPSEVQLLCEDKSPYPCAPGVRTVFHSSTRGTGSDNPNDPDDLDPVQAARSVSFNFEDTSCWEFTYDHYCPVEQDDYDGPSNASVCPKNTGGYFLFAGKSDTIINEGECIYPDPTPSPTVSPTVKPTSDPTKEPTCGPDPTPPPTSDPTVSPTVKPTSDPTSEPTVSPTVKPTSDPTVSPTVKPTSEPTSEPTETPREATDAPTIRPTAPPSAVPTEYPDPPPPVPTQCPDDLTLAKITGVTMPPELGDAVQILSQDTSTVTVRLLNAWSTDEPIDSIFYYYHIDHLHDTCVEETDVPGGDDYADITLACYNYAAFAELDICVVDGEALSEGDDAEVPTCCHPGEIEVPVVCYKILVQCDTVCVDAEERLRALRGAR